MYIKPEYVKEVFAQNGDIILFNPLNDALVRIDKSNKEKYKEYSKLGVYSINDKFLINNFFFDENDTLNEDAIVENLINIMDKKRILHLTILPTENCNFRCVYCYENYQNGKMKFDVAESIIKYVREALSEYEGLTISWFGGEPLIAIDVIEYISNEIITICKQLKKVYIAEMTTNGYLLSLDVMQRLYKMRIFKYQITIDGDAKTHDKQRFLFDGSPTYDVIIKNILEIRDKFRKKFLCITLRTNLTKQVMAESIDTYLEFLENNFANDDMFNLRFRVAWEPDNKKTEKNLYFTEQSDLLNILYEKLRKYKNLRFDDELDELHPMGGVCYAANKDSYVIGSNGIIYKCTVHFDDPINKIGYLNKDGKLDIDHNKMNYWIKRNIVKEECKHCSLKLSCLGIGCPYNSGIKNTCNAVSEQSALILELMSNYTQYCTKIDTI